MLIFKQGLEAVTTIFSLNQLFEQREGDPADHPYEMDAGLPDYTTNPGVFYYPSNYVPVPDGGVPLGAYATYAKTRATVSSGQETSFSKCCLPTPPDRTADTILYYQPIGSGIKVLVTSRIWESGTEQYALIHDPNTLKIVMYNGTARGVYGMVTPTGDGSPLGGEIRSFGVSQLDYDAMVDENVIVSTLGQELFSKEWVENYINQKLEVVIPKAIDESVRQSEIVISQRYVSR